MLKGDEVGVICPLRTEGGIGFGEAEFYGDFLMNPVFPHFPWNRSKIGYLGDVSWIGRIEPGWVRVPPLLTPGDYQNKDSGNEAE